jgi:dipeptidyl-peptidase-4
MKTLWILFLTPLLVLSQKMLTVEAIYSTPELKPPEWPVTAWRPGNTQFSYAQKCNGDYCIFYIHLETGEKFLLVNSENLPILEAPRREKRFILPNYIWSPDGKQLLIPADQDLFLYDLDTQKVTRLTLDPYEERDPSFSPDGKWIAFLKNGCLCLFNLNSMRESELIRQENNQLIGRFDWVYEEEFEIRKGYFWSPDSRSIAFYNLDISEEPRLFLEGSDDNDSADLRYPKAGDPNAKVRIGVINIKNRQMTWMETGRNTDSYIPRIYWMPDAGFLLIQRLNRLQNRLDLILSNVSTGRSRILLTEKDDEGWVDVLDDPLLLQKQQAILWLSERDNRTHIYRVDENGSVSQITRGEWDVTDLLYADEPNGWIYFTATEKSPLERHLYRIRFDGSEFIPVTRSEGEHIIDMSPDGSYFIDTFSNCTTPPQITLHRSNGELIAILSSGNIPALQDYELAVPEFIHFTASDGLKLNAMFLKPPSFDPQKRYPVLIYTYGCPGSQRVINNWQRGQGNLWHQLLAQHGYCLFTLDNRGTGLTGNSFKNRVYRNIGRGLQDQIEAAERLKRLDYVDPDRLGIWGWSGGGWMTLLAMTKGAPHFKTGIAVAPVSDFRFYDTIYTERYMGLPDDNGSGYDQSSALTYADQFQGSLLLIHGTADDNVHVENTFKMAEALQNRGLQFEMMLYPGKNHDIDGQGTRIHLYNMMTRFILENL